MKRSRNKFIPVERLRPGQEFTHYGQHYRRATDEEIDKHPGREHARYERGHIVLAYGLANQPVPVTFVTDCRVVVQGGKT